MGGQENRGDLQIHGMDKEDARLPAMQQLFVEAREKTLSAKVIVFPNESDFQKQLAKRRHDVKGAVRTLNFAIDAIRNGYRFDDERSEAKIDAITKAIKVLQRQTPHHCEILEP